MEVLWKQSHLNCTAPPRTWKRYVDDTLVIQHQSHKEDFFRCINLVDPSIQFTMEESEEDGSIPFLDTIITPQPDGTFTIGVHRKPTHADLYLPWDKFVIKLVQLTPCHTEQGCDAIDAGITWSQWCHINGIIAFSRSRQSNRDVTWLFGYLMPLALASHDSNGTVNGTWHWCKHW